MLNKEQRKNAIEALEAKIIAEVETVASNKITDLQDTMNQLQAVLEAAADSLRSTGSDRPDPLALVTVALALAKTAGGTIDSMEREGAKE